MSSRITIEPGKRSGQPCIRNLRITVWDVLSWLASGMTEQEIRGQAGPARRPVKILFDEKLRS